LFHLLQTEYILINGEPVKLQNGCTAVGRDAGLHRTAVLATKQAGSQFNWLCDLGHFVRATLPLPDQ